jgi:low affinity Fe/Cu permease
MTRPTEQPTRTTVVYDDERLPRGRSSWSAIVAGVVAAFVVMLVLQVLMLWLGLSAIDPVRESNPFAGLGTGAAIGYLLSMAIALFVGGLVTGRLANRVNGSDVFWHGFLTWGVFTLASLGFAFTAAGALVSGTIGVVGNAAGAVGGGVAAFAPDLAETQAMLEDQLELSDDVIDELEPLWADPEARREFADEIAAVFEDGSATIDAADRQDLIAFIADNTELSQTEIESRVDRWIERFEEAQARLVELEDDLRMAGEEAADALANAAMWAFFGLILGALITWLGARAGAPSSRAETTRA